MKPAIYIFAIFFLTLLACKDKESVNPTDDLPPETQTGQNTFGCVVNGRAWVPSAPFPLNHLTYSYYRGTFSIRATLKKDDRYQVIYVSRDSVTKNGIYILNDALNHKRAHFADLNSSCIFETNTTNVGNLEMTRVDSINGIFSGRFSFKIGVAGCDTIRVANGRFDVKL